ncbi:proline dehydrogenase family protein [Adhaeribacter sp. BT258]|uniref:Proline dehydrogenase family protein n=1 Tax=Adhaeribacter terrigena TaxID=2793070 RepID=A0ABS1BZ04_9BACT|nr:proline dehydrogenase family protein [Adhaeribacter terrigena]MBK0402400.1 proline dehydrogenase family protein [Adhaeribacter terrigena]
MQTNTLNHNSTTQPDFNNLTNAFAHKSDHELRLAYWLFRVVNNPALMKLSTTAAKWSLAMGLPVKSLLKGTIYRHFCGGETVNDALPVIDKLHNYQVSTVLDYAAEAEVTEAGFEHVKNQILNNISLAKNTPGIGYISVKMTGLGSPEIFEKVTAGKKLNEAEDFSLEKTFYRLHEICKRASEAGISVYIDAEESWIQKPIDDMAEKMMRMYNQERTVVYNTLQMYRTDRLAYLKDFIHRMEDRPGLLGIKLVRGAYWEKERERAAQKGQPSPVFDTKEGTDKSFDDAILLCLRHLPKVHLCIATHNQKSTELLVSEITKSNIRFHHKVLHFSQLYGMSDNLTFALAKAGFSASKYLPYGEVKKAMPYLMRRAEENTAIAGQMSRELNLLEAEMKRRNL